MALACRICRIAIEAAEGCSICNPVRKNLIAVGESEEDKPSLAGVSQEIVGDLKRSLRSLRLEDPTLETEKRLLAIGNTIAKVLETARKLQDDGVDAVNAMSFDERTSLFLSWFINLPAAYRKSVMEKMSEYELQISKPVENTGATDGAN